MAVAVARSAMDKSWSMIATFGRRRALSVVHRWLGTHILRKVDMVRTLTTAALTAAALALTTLMIPTAAEAGSCGGFAYATPFKRGKVSTSNCGVLGSPGVKVYYSWNVGGASSGRACVEGLGYEPLQGPTAHGGPPGYRERWFSLGCGTRGGFGVPWGNVGAVPKVRAESLMVPLGVPIQWRH